MKKDYAEIFKELVEQNDYVLLSDYVNARTKVKIRCNKGHEYKVTPNEFKKGSRCPECPRNYSIQAKKEFLELLTKEGYILIGEYTNNKTKVLIRCDKGHEYKVKPNDFKSGYRCPICSCNCPIQAKKEFLELLAKERYELIGEYKNNKTKIKIRCKKGHEYKVKPSHFKQGIRCPICAGCCPIQAEKDFLELLESIGYELINEYINNYTKVKIRCPKGHEYKVRPYSFKSGRRCPICAGHISQKEIYILDYVRSILNEEVISGDRTNIINPKTGNYLELDIWIPSLNKAIEFNGTYWHSDEYSKYKDEIKKKYCEVNGINLMVIEELEYDNDLELCLNEIDNFLGI